MSEERRSCFHPDKDLLCVWDKVHDFKVVLWHFLKLLNFDSINREG